MNNPYLAPGAALSDTYGHDEPYTPSIFSVHGRIGRLRYLAYGIGAMLLVAFAGGFISAILAYVVGSSGSAESMGVAMLGTIGLLVYVPIIVLSFIFAKRRLNDLNKSGWWSVLTLVPLVNVLLAIYLIFFPGTNGSNDYGPMPIKNSTGVVIGAFGFLIVPAVVGILAAIAIPAYQDYVTRAKNAQPAASSDAQELQEMLQQQLEQQQSRP